MQQELAEKLKPYGVAKDDVFDFSSPSYELIDFLDLFDLDRDDRLSGKLPPLSGVVLSEGQPVLYVLDHRDLVGLKGEEHNSIIPRMRALLACRGGNTFLGILKQGEVIIHRVRGAGQNTEQTVSNTDVNAPLLYANLSAGRWTVDEPSSPQEQADQKAIERLLIDLLGGVTQELRALPRLKSPESSDAVLSLVGRALFTRFLVDRCIINEKTFPALYKAGGPTAAFASASNAAMVCKWLDDTFNGELLALPVQKGNYLGYFQSLAVPKDGIFRSLSKIVERTNPDGQHFMDWVHVDFAHVPVGLLSAAYENYSHSFFRDPALDESMHYTPRHIASFMVDQAFDGVPQYKRHKVRALDPAAGAGVFLVLVFRRIVQECWRVNGRRPGSDELHTILREQIRGFDINSHALKLAALSLHLTAVELDPEPANLAKLRFEKLEGRTLLNTRGANEPFPAYPVLGSLGGIVGPEHDNAYDLVIANPPWTAWKGTKASEMNQVATALARDVLRARKVEPRGRLPYLNPDNVPDLPFVWKATRWARSGGVIAYVLHGRLLYKRSNPGSSARDWLFDAIDVTGVVDGTGLDTSFWPGINQPYCLLFARNRTPEERHFFRFVVPTRDSALNATGRFRIDPECCYTVDTSLMRRKPYLLKALFRGGNRDLDLIDRIEALSETNGEAEPTKNSGEEQGERKRKSVDLTRQQPVTAQRLADFWRTKNSLHYGVGYQIAGQGSSAKEILDLGAYDLRSSDRVGYWLDSTTLEPFKHRKLHRPRAPEIYRPPLVVFNKAPGETDRSARARIALGKKPVAYFESFCGYSAHGHPRGPDLARLLFLVGNSDLFLYYALMTSAKFGIERRVVYAEDIANFPLILLDRLSDAAIEDAREIVEQFRWQPDNTALKRLNKWVYKQYRLTPGDVQLITDTLSTRLPYTTTESRAESPPKDQSVKAARSLLEDGLRRILKTNTVSVGEFTAPSSGWRFCEITKHNGNTKKDLASMFPKLAARIADDSGASFISASLSNDVVLLGVLNQTRYFTASRVSSYPARLVQQHGDALLS